MFKKTQLKLGAVMMTAITLSSTSAFAEPPGDGGNTFSSIAENIVTSVQSLPGLVSALAYLFGILLAVLGIMKIKEHVENPTQTQLSAGAIRLAAGGALFALPIVFESMFNTIGPNGDADVQQELVGVEFNVNLDDGE